MNLETVIELMLALVFGAIIVVFLAGGFQAAYPGVVNATKNLTFPPGTPIDVHVSGESFNSLKCAIEGVINNQIPSCPKGEYDSSVSCSSSGGKVSCEVRNFVLPQQISTPEAFIRDYGDPKFMVYWQKFPDEEENTWTFMAGEEGYQIAWEVAIWTGIGRWQEVSKSGIVSKLNNVIFKNPTKSLVGVGTILTAQMADAFFGRMIPQENALVMYIPGETLFNFSLPDSWRGKPILLKEKETTFHLVSPCYTLSMDVTKENVYCNKYVYYPDTRMVSCEGPKFGLSKTEGYRKCTDCSSASGGCDVKTSEIVDGESISVYYRYDEKCMVESIVISDVKKDDVAGVYNYCYYRPDWATRLFNWIGIPVSPQFTAALGAKIAGQMIKAGATAPGTNTGWFKGVTQKTAGTLLSGIGSAIYYCNVFTGNPTCHADEKFLGFPIMGARWPGVKQ